MKILGIQRTLLNDLVFTLITQALWGPQLSQQSEG